MKEGLLDLVYRVKDNKPSIRLYYKPKSQVEDKDVVNVEDFKPYFYALPSGDVNELVEEITAAGLPQIVETNVIKRIDVRNEIDVVEIITRAPGDVPEIRDKIRELRHCKDIREANIRFVQRYLIDSGITPMKGIMEMGPRIASFDIETSQLDSKKESGDLILMISYADNLGLKKVWTYRHDSELPFVEKLGSEKEMIEKFMEVVKSQRIDILLTYNGDNFDFGMLKDRCAHFGMKFALGADGDEVKLERRGMDMGARVNGRPHIDLYPVCRRMFNLPRYTLEDVYTAIFEEEKLDIEVDKLEEVWAEGKKEKIEELFQYSMEDAEACLKIGLEMLPLEYELSQLISQPVFEVSRMGSGNKVEWLLMKKAHDSNVLVPNNPGEREAKERAGDTYEGAYVVEPKKGIHDNILVFDFKSLYPSIIIAHNVDPATLNCDCCDDPWVAPTGAKFCKKKKGFIPEILETLMRNRAKIKLEMRKLKAEKSPDKARIKVLDAQQQAVKILANSFYGYMGYARAKWYSRDCARAITAWGRDYIKSTIEKAEAEGMNVVYGDTDSLLITMPGEFNEKEMNSKKNEFLKKINDSLPPAMELEFEGFFPRGVFVTKKRYALIDKNRKLTVKGLETKRRDWANIAKHTQEEVLQTILWDKDPKKAADIVKEKIEKLRNNEIPLGELVINTQLTKSLGEYQNTGPHIEAARKAQKRGKTVRAGDMIQYIITKKGNSISDKAKMLGFVEENEYDSEYYINNQLLPAVMRVLEAFGYSDEELKGNGKQMTLSGW